MYYLNLMKYVCFMPFNVVLVYVAASLKLNWVAEVLLETMHVFIYL